MTARLSRAAQRQIEAVVLDSAERFGEDAAVRYRDLILAVASLVGREPDTPAASGVPGQASVWAYHLRLGRKLMPQARRVGRPRHLLLYRVRRSGEVLVLGLVHERMLLDRAAAELARRSVEE